jgi:hypothetical protein
MSGIYASLNKVRTKVICQKSRPPFRMPTVDDFDRRRFAKCWSVTRKPEDDGQRRQWRKVVRGLETEHIEPWLTVDFVEGIYRWR